MERDVLEPSEESIDGGWGHELHQKQSIVKEYDEHENKLVDLATWKQNPTRVVVEWWGQKPVWSDSEKMEGGFEDSE